MMSIQPEGSLYEEQNVGPFHKPQLYHQQHKENGHSKLLFDDRLPTTADIGGLSTPDVTSLLTGVESSLITSQAPTPTRYLRGDITTEQEMYARGFLEALDELHAGNRQQPEATMAPSDLKLVSSNNSNSNSTNRLVDAASMAARPVHHSSQELASSSQFISGPNPSIEAVAPTYVTATMDFIPNIAPPSHSEPSSAYAAPTTNSFTANTYTPTVINHFTPMIDYSGGYSASSALGAPTHAQPSGMTGGSNSALPTQMMKELQRVVPADIKTQEQMKQERKKARNRIAASKCRLRRLQRESDLQGKVRVLKEHNQELNHEVTDLKAQISNLKKALVQHMKGGCHVNLPESYGLRSDSSSSSE